MNSVTKILLEKSVLLNRIANVQNTSSLPVLWFFTDQIRNPDPYSIINQLPKNSGVILRDYNVPNRKILANKIAEICRKRHLVYLIGGDVKLALELGASGIHIPDFKKLELPYIRPKKDNWIIRS